MSNRDNSIQEWYYAKDADITFGEVYVSKLPKIILAIVAVLVVASTTLGIIYKDYIYDYFVNPKVTFISSVRDNQNTVQVEVYSDFNAMKYIDTLTASYLDSVVGAVDTSQIGDYSITYYSKNKVYTHKLELLVQVRDTTPPYIELDAQKDMLDEIYYLDLIRGDSTDTFTGTNDFNPLDYIKDYGDNYSPKEKLTITTSNADFGTEGAKTIGFYYFIDDENGNENNVRLIISVNDDEEAIRREQEERIRKMEEELEKLRQQQLTVTPNPNISNEVTAIPTAVINTPTPKPTNTPTPKPTPTNTPIPTQGQPSPTPTDHTNTPTPTVAVGTGKPHPSKERIVVHNMTELEQEMSKLYVQDATVGAYVEYGDVNPTISGTYKAYLIAFDNSYTLEVIVIVESDIPTVTPKPTATPKAQPTNTPTPTPKPTDKPKPSVTPKVERTFKANDIVITVAQADDDATLDRLLKSSVSYSGYDYVEADLSTLGFTPGIYSITWKAHYSQNVDTYTQTIIIQDGT